MKLAAWLLKLGFFLLELWFALKNTTPVPVRFSADIAWEHVPLIVVMLACVALGALLGALSLSLPIYKMRREMAHLKRVSPPPSTESSPERMTSAARQSGAVAELSTGERN